MHPDEEVLLDRYVRHPEALSLAETREAERLIEADEGAACYMRHLREFYALLEEEPAEMHPQVERFVDNLFEEKGSGLEKSDKEAGSGEKASGPGPTEDRPPATTEARPIGRKRETGPTVLAAATKTTRSGSARSDTRQAADAPGPFQTFATLASEGGNVLVRVIGNPKENRGRVYVLSNDPERKAWAVVSVPELERHLVTGEDGTATFDLAEDERPDRWAGATALVRRPVAEARIESGDETPLHLISGETPRRENSLSRTDGATGIDSSSPAVRCWLSEGRFVAEQEQPLLSFLAAWPEGNGDPTLLALGEGSGSCKVPEGRALLVRAYQ
jgi:hypothetical protein